MAGRTQMGQFCARWVGGQMFLIAAEARVESRVRMHNHAS
jgi:hypothetical protein